MANRRRRLTFTLFALALGAAAAGAHEHEPNRLDQLRVGHRLITANDNYKRLCAACHGDNGDGIGTEAVARRPRDFGSPAAVATLTREGMIEAVAREHDDSTRARWTDELDRDATAAIVDYIRDAFMLPIAMADASVGRRIYARTCSVCHGERGDAASWARNSLHPPPREFTSEKARRMTRHHMITAVTYGREGTAMMPFAIQLTREEIASTVDYIRRAFMRIEGDVAEMADASEAGGDAAVAHDRHAEHGHHGGGAANMSAPFPASLVGDFKKGRAFFKANCAECHGNDGNGKGPRAYFMTKKPRNFTGAEARAELNRPHLFKAISMGTVGTEMSAWSKVLDAQQIANVAEFVFRAFVVADAAPVEEPEKAEGGAAAPTFEAVPAKKKD